MSADKPFTPSARDLQELFDDVPYIPQDFLWEVKLLQEDILESQKRWASVGPLLDRMLEAGLPVESGHLEVRRVEGEKRFEIEQVLPWNPPQTEESRIRLERFWELSEQMRPEREKEAARKKADRNAALRRFGLPELEGDNG